MCLLYVIARMIMYVMFLLRQRRLNKLIIILIILSEGLLQAEAMEHFAGDNDHGNHGFYSIIMVAAMALATSTCVWRS